MSLDEAQQKRVQEWLDSNFECPKCGRTKLWTADLLIAAQRKLP